MFCVCMQSARRCPSYLNHLKKIIQFYVKPARAGSTLLWSLRLRYIFFLLCDPGFVSFANIKLITIPNMWWAYWISSLFLRNKNWLIYTFDCVPRSKLLFYVWFFVDEAERIVDNQIVSFELGISRFIAFAIKFHPEVFC